MCLSIRLHNFGYDAHIIRHKNIYQTKNFGSDQTFLTRPKRFIIHVFEHQSTWFLIWCSHHSTQEYIISDRRNTSQALYQFDGADWTKLNHTLLKRWNEYILKYDTHGPFNVSTYVCMYVCMYLSLQWTVYRKMLGSFSHSNISC